MTVTLDLHRRNPEIELLVTQVIAQAKASALRSRAIALPVGAEQALDILDIVAGGIVTLVGDDE
ncbi:MAG: hypothetical protein HC838_12070 [Spirulinaceae cyanobacterium RM2_2_10]|nr:hypothetical protein [Spirulinaceae cyanobacterium SM2_1_0]NJO20621.1 hypothetical protein [Spirulinaceae cyanobacterium RM2_2_10]